jgi:hypothetical protein
MFTEHNIKIKMKRLKGLHGINPGLHGVKTVLHGINPGLHGINPGLHGVNPVGVVFPPLGLFSFSCASHLSPGSHYTWARVCGSIPFLILPQTSISDPGMLSFLSLFL